jgi:hypothetical protein
VSVSRREIYDASRDRKVREMVREILAEPEFVALLAEAAHPDAPRALRDLEAARTIPTIS